MLNFSPPAVIIYTNRIHDGGLSFACVILLRTKYKNDKGLHAHELFHVRMWWLTIGLAGVLRRFSKRYRLWEEAQAYLRQTRHHDHKGRYLSLEKAAKLLANDKYNLGLTEVQLLMYLKQATTI